MVLRIRFAAAVVLPLTLVVSAYVALREYAPVTDPEPTAGSSEVLDGRPAEAAETTDELMNTVIGTLPVTAPAAAAVAEGRVSRTSSVREQSATDRASRSRDTGEQQSVLDRWWTQMLSTR